FCVEYQVTVSGELISLPQILAYITLLLFLFVLIFTFYYTTKKINYERWYDSILRKYEMKNTAKMIISSFGYNLMKNAFVWYYLFGLPIILLITDICYTFGVNSMIELMKIILAVYWFGFILVGIYFFGILQEWIVNLKDEIESIGWGVDR